MKKIFTSVILLMLSTAIFSQQTNSQQTVVPNDFLKKSKNQKKAGRILLIGGAGLIITGFVIPRGDLIYDGICVGPYCSDEYKNDNLKAALVITGAALDLVSIPFFIASKKNRKRSAAISFKNEKISQGYMGSIINRPAPSINLKISL